MKRQLTLGAGLAATLLATWYAARLPDEVVEDSALLAPARQRAAPASASAPAASSSSPGPGVAVVASAPIAPGVGAGVAAVDPRVAPPRAALMPPLDWRPPPPPAPRPAAAPAPQAPPLPFRYLGRIDEGDGALAVFLADGAQVRPLVVRSGDRIRDYQVEAVTASGVRFVYLPLNQTQQMLFGTEP